MAELIHIIVKRNIGCKLGDLFTGILVYTDDIVLLVPRRQGLDISPLGLCTHLTITFFSSGLCLDSWGGFAPVLALCDPFGVDVPLNLDNTHSLTPRRQALQSMVNTCSSHA